MNYLELAEQAKGEKAHVAVVMYYRNAVEQAVEPATVEAIIGSAVEYAGCLKKPTDQQAVYDWAQGITTGTELVEKINTAMQELGGKENDTTPTA
ncbi:MAG: hypothetical protein KAT77_06275 [Nanoarchaeota archaeon]|nr:hypothetical protein [Nanoarchaeota archaeon]